MKKWLLILFLVLVSGGIYVLFFQDVDRGPRLSDIADSSDPHAHEILAVMRQKAADTTDADYDTRLMTLLEQADGSVMLNLFHITGTIYGGKYDFQRYMAKDSLAMLTDDHLLVLIDHLLRYQTPYRAPITTLFKMAATRPGGPDNESIYIQAQEAVQTGVIGRFSFYDIFKNANPNTTLAMMRHDDLFDASGNLHEDRLYEQQISYVLTMIGNLHKAYDDHAAMITRMYVSSVRPGPWWTDKDVRGALALSDLHNDYMIEQPASWQKDVLQQMVTQADEDILAEFFRYIGYAGMSVGGTTYYTPGALSHIPADIRLQMADIMEAGWWDTSFDVRAAKDLREE